VEGVEAGPRFINCSQWNFHHCFPNDTDACSVYTDCGGCIDSKIEPCGWCQNGANSQCMDASANSNCQGKWTRTQCTAPVFTCSLLLTCDECVNYPPGECVWCSHEGDCRLAIEVGTSCDYSCAGRFINPGLIVGLVVVGVAVVGVIFGVWYRFYWVKRHYYERLR